MMKYSFLIFICFLSNVSFTQVELQFVTENAGELSKGIEKDIVFDEKYKNFFRKNRKMVSRINRRLSIWEKNDSDASRWNYDEAGFYTEAANKEKLEIIGDEILRYFKKETKEPLKQQFRIWRQGLRRNYSIDSDIELTEDDEGDLFDLINFEKVFVKKETNSNSAKIKVGEKKKSSKKKKRLIRFRLKSKVTRGVLIGKVQTPYLEFSALAGVNKQVDLSISKWFRKPALYFRFGSDILEQKYYGQIDKYFLNKRLKVRFSTESNKTKQLDFKDNSLLSFSYIKNF